MRDLTQSDCLRRIAMWEFYADSTLTTVQQQGLRDATCGQSNSVQMYLKGVEIKLPRSEGRVKQRSGRRQVNSLGGWPTLFVMAAPRARILFATLTR